MDLCRAGQAVCVCVRFTVAVSICEPLLNINDSKSNTDLSFSLCNTHTAVVTIPSVKLFICCINCWLLLRLLEHLGFKLKPSALLHTR